MLLIKNAISQVYMSTIVLELGSNLRTRPGTRGNGAGPAGPAVAGPLISKLRDAITLFMNINKHGCEYCYRYL